MIQQGSVPAGTYVARFLGVEDTQHDEYGAGLRFRFEVVGGSCAGHVASRVTKAFPTPGNSAGRMLAGLCGRSLNPEDEVDVQEFVGRHYMIVVEQTTGGATRVSTVAPADKE